MAKKRIVATGNWSSMNQPPKASKPQPPTETRRFVAREGTISPVDVWPDGTGPNQSTVEPQTAPDKPGIFAKAKNMAKSYASKGLNGKRADDEVVEIRSMSCHGLQDIGLAPCEFRGTSEENEGRQYCLECGCGDRKATWLNEKEAGDYTKLHFPAVVCPLNMPGFSNYTPVENEPEERVSHYKGFLRKKKIQQYASMLDVDLVQLTLGQTNE